MLSARSDWHYPEQFPGISGIRTGLIPADSLDATILIQRTGDLENMDVEQPMPVGP